jgi:hypothetical protein
VLLDLGIGVNELIFQISGNIPWSRDRRKRALRGKEITCLRLYKKSPDIPSEPIDVTLRREVI